MVDRAALRRMYVELLDEKIIDRLAQVKGVSRRAAMDAYYRSRLSDEIRDGAYGIDNMDYRYLVDDLIENEPELFDEETVLNEATLMLRMKAMTGKETAKGGGSSANVTDTVTDVTETVTDVTENQAGMLTPEDSRLLGYIQENPAITTTQLAEKLGVVRQTVYRRLKNLKESGVITRVGSDRSGHWQVNATNTGTGKEG